MATTNPGSPATLADAQPTAVMIYSLDEIFDYARAIAGHSADGHRTAQPVTDALAAMTLQLAAELAECRKTLTQIVWKVDQTQGYPAAVPGR